MNGYEQTDSVDYKGRRITVHHYKPDFIVHVDGSFIGFYLSSGAGLNGGQKYIDRIEEAA